MIFSDEVLLQLAVFILGVCGFLVARHIYKHKSNAESPLVCPIQFDCHAVVHSDYSKLFGVPVEIFGMIYYTTISVAYLLLIIMPSMMPTFMPTALLVLSKVAFLFSLYLIGVQIFALKKGCSWCIVSAIISTLILVFGLFTYNFDPMFQILNRFF